MAEYLIGHWVACLALASAAVAAGMALGPRTRRWSRWLLGLAALATLVSPWLPARRMAGAALAWPDGVGYVVVFAVAWALGLGADRRTTLLGLAGGLVAAAMLSLLVPANSAQAHRALWPLTLQVLCGGAAGVALGAAALRAVADGGRDTERASQLVLALESAALFGSLVVRQAHLGVAWGWDGIAMWHLFCWLASVLICQAIAVWRLRPLPQRALLAGLGLLLLTQSALTAALMDGLGYVSTWIVG